MTRNQSAPTRLTQPISPMVYTAISLLGLIIAIAFTFFYIYRVPQLVQSSVQGQIFYLLLIPWALSCAAFLFGAMKSYAGFTYKRLGGALELGGPVVLFCLVLVGGFKLVPSAPEVFDLTVRARSNDGLHPLITSGKVTVEFDTALLTESFGINGEANFKGIPRKFEGATVRVLPQVDGYEQSWQSQSLRRHLVELVLARAPQPITLLTGSIVPAPSKKTHIRILVDGQMSETSADEFGRFALNVNGNAGETIRLKVYANNRLAYDDYQYLPGPVTLTLH